MEIRGLICQTIKPPPTNYSNWVIENYLLAAANPARSNDMIEKYISAGLNVYVSLQEIGEANITSDNIYPYIDGKSIDNYIIDDIIVQLKIVK